MEVKVLDVKWQRPTVTIHASDGKAFRKYLSAGYYVFKRENGQCTMRKKALIFVTFEENGKIETLNLRKELACFYGTNKTEQLVEMFQDDLKQGQIKLKVDSKGYYFVKE